MFQVEANGYSEKIIPFEVPKVTNEMIPVHAELNIILYSLINSSSGSGSITVREAVTINGTGNGTGQSGQPEKTKSSRSFALGKSPTNRENLVEDGHLMVEAEHGYHQNGSGSLEQVIVVKEKFVRVDAITSSAGHKFLDLTITMMCFLSGIWCFGES